MRGLIEMTPLLFHYSSTLSFFGNGAMRQLIPRLPVLHSKAARISKSDPATSHNCTRWKHDSQQSFASRKWEQWTTLNIVADLWDRLELL